MATLLVLLRYNEVAIFCYAYTMEQMIERIIAIGYSPDKAENLYHLYDRQGDLDGLESYVLSMESVEKMLS